MQKDTPLIFDVDGTLWDSSETCARAWTACLRDHGVPRVITAADLQRCMGKTLAEFAQTMFPDMASNDGKQLVRGCFQYEVEFLTREGADLYDGVLDGMRKLAGTYPIFVVSNCDTDYLASFIFASGLGPVVKDALCHGDTGRPKHDNLFTMKAKHGMTAAVYVGDTRSDEEAARKAGMAFVFAEYGFGEAVTPDLRVCHFGQLVDRFLPVPPIAVTIALEQVVDRRRIRRSTHPRRLHRANDTRLDGPCCYDVEDA